MQLHGTSLEGRQRNVLRRDERPISQDIDCRALAQISVQFAEDGDRERTPSNDRDPLGAGFELRTGNPLDAVVGDEAGEGHLVAIGGDGDYLVRRFEDLSPGRIEDDLAASAYADHAGLFERSQRLPVGVPAEFWYGREMNLVALEVEQIPEHCCEPVLVAGL